MQKYSKDIYTVDVTKFEEIRTIFFHFLEMISKGNETQAKAFLSDSLMSQTLFFQDDLDESKLNIQIVNSYCSTVLANTHVRTEECFKVYRNFRKRIYLISSPKEIPHILEDLCYQYCFLSHHNFFPEYPKSVNSVINYIHANYEQPINLTSISKYFERNATTLSATFRKYTGNTISNYIQQVRINKAMELFDLTNQSVSEVSVAVGFQDFSYFSKVFKKQAGCSPKEYREQHK